MNAEGLGGFLAGLGRGSLQVGVLVVAVLAAQWVFRSRLTPRWRAALWLLVVLRLCLPVSMGSAFSVFNLMPKAGPSSPPSLVSSTSPVVSPRPGAAPNRASLSETPPSPTFPESRMPAAIEDQPVETFDQVVPPSRALGRSADEPAVTARRPIPWSRSLFSVWALGVVVLGGYVALDYRRFTRRLRSARTVADAGINAALAECVQRLEVGSGLTVRECPEVTSPALHGCVRPVLLLPPGFAERFTPAEQRHVFLHELAHLKRRDLPLNWLFVVLQILHWFNPLVWLAFSRWRADRELACDAMALEAVGDSDGQEYGRTILHLLESLRAHPSVPGLVGIMEDRSLLRRRIEMIAAYVPTRRWPVIAVALFVGLAAIGLTDRLAAQVEGRLQKIEIVLPEIEGSFSLTNEGPTLLLHVVDDATGETVPDAEVTLSAIHLQSDGTLMNGFPGPKTDTNGVALLPPGGVLSEPGGKPDWFPFAVRKAGYGGRVFSGDRKSRGIDATTPEFTARLKRAKPIGGTVVDAAGKPLPGVRLRFFGSDALFLFSESNLDAPLAWPRTDQQPDAITDAQGRWQIPDFPEELRTFVLDLVLPDGARRRFMGRSLLLDSMSAQTWCTTSLPVDWVETKDLLAGDAVLRISEGVTVRGQVVDSSGRPLAGALVREGQPDQGYARHVANIWADGQGRFELSHRSAQQMLLTAETDGLAAASAVVEVRPGMRPVRLVLPPHEPLRVSVVDASGHPVAGASVRCSAPDHLGLDWGLHLCPGERKTDSSGQIVWTNAPLGPLGLYVYARPTDDRTNTLYRTVRVRAGQRDVTILLDPEKAQRSEIRGRAHDAETGKPVVIRLVKWRLDEWAGPGMGRSFNAINALAFTNSLSASDFNMPPGSSSFRVLICADGYVPYLTETLLLGEDLDADFALKPEPKNRPVVEKPDGTLAALPVVFGDSASGLNLPREFLKPFHTGPDADRGTTGGSDGTFSLEEIPNEDWVTIMHPSGVLVTTAETIRAAHVVRLTATGGIHATVFSEGHPATNLAVTVQKVTSLYSPSVACGRSVRTDANGQFVLTDLPAGGYSVSQDFDLRPARGNFSLNHAMAVVVSPGAVTNIVYGGTGRTVTGRLFSVSGQKPIDWMHDGHWLVAQAAAKRNWLQNGRVMVRVGAYVSNQAYVAAQAAAGMDPAEQVRCVIPGCYQLEATEDGRFQAHDVPPGTYQVFVRVTKTDGGSSFVTVAETMQEVVVPDGSGAFDLGAVGVSPVQRRAEIY